MRHLSDFYADESVPNAQVSLNLIKKHAKMHVSDYEALSPPIKHLYKKFLQTYDVSQPPSPILDRAVTYYKHLNYIILKHNLGNILLIRDLSIINVVQLSLS